MFNIVGEQFFTPLAAPGKVMYWECICKLFTVTDHQLSFGVERDLLVEELQYYFEQKQAVELNEEELLGKSARDKANWVLRRLEYYGWIDIDTDKSYVQRVNFTEHAVKIIKLLLEIENGKTIEYQGYIYTIYSLVRGKSDNPGIELLSIVENTDMLITGLKNLSSSIKRYIDELTKYKTPAEIMDALFNDYMTNIVDKAYHRLLTSDNVSKFRPEIVERLESYSRSKTYVEKASNELANIKELSKEEAEELVYHYIHLVIDAFGNMDEILSEINNKNSKYQSAAVNRAKFYLIGGEDIRGQLKDILSILNEQINEEKLELGGIYRIEFFDDLIRVYQSLVVDDESFYKPTEGKKQFVPQVLEEEVIDEDLRDEKILKIRRKLENVLNPSKIENYIAQYMGDKDNILASNLPIESAEDFIKIIYTRLYGQRKNMKYKVEVSNDDYIEINGYRFKDFSIIKKSK